MDQLKSRISVLRPSIALFLPLALWLLVWLGLQAGSIEEIGDFDDPEAFVHSLRSALPLWAAYMAVVIFFVKIYRQRSNGISFFGPLGFVTVYGFVGLAASVLSTDGSVALYGAAVYLSVPLVLWGIVWGKDGLGTVHRVINLNWLIIILGVAALFTVALLYLNLGALMLTPSSWFECTLYREFMGSSWHDLTSGLLRPTGVGRYAAIGGIIALGGLWHRQWRLVWVAVLLVCLILLLTSGARGAFVGFGAGAALVTAFYAGRKTVAGGALALLVLAPVVWFTGVHQQFFDSCIIRKGSPAPLQVLGSSSDSAALEEKVLLELPITLSVPERGWYLQQVSSGADVATTGFERKPGENEVESSTDVSTGRPLSAETQATSEVLTRVLIPLRFSGQPISSSQEQVDPDTYSRLSIQPGVWELKPWYLLQPGVFSIKVQDGDLILEQAAPNETPELVFLTGSSGIRSLTGRTAIWAEGIKLFKEQPILGYGFNADRLLLGTHMHNSFMHALVQTGLVGTIPFIIALLFAWLLLIKALRNRAGLPLVHRHLLIQVAGVLAFLSIRGISESTGAFYGVDWLLLAPILVYLQVVGRAVNSVEEAT